MSGKGPVEYGDVTPEMMTERLMGLVGDWYQSTAMALGGDRNVPKLRANIQAELKSWHVAMVKKGEPECEHPVSLCEVIMHKGAYAVLCSKCMCTSLVDQDIWEPHEEKPQEVVPGFRGE